MALASDILPALSGVIIGFLLNHFSQRIGSVYLSLNYYDFIYKGKDDWGNYLPIEDLNKCEFAEFKIEADFFNNTNIPKGFKNFKIIFKNNDFVYECIPNVTLADNNNILTLMPKQFVRIKINDTIEPQGSIAYLQKIDACPNIYLTANNHKNKLVKWTIKSKK